MEHATSRPMYIYLLAAISIVLLSVAAFIRTYPGYFLSDDYNLLWIVSKHGYADLFLPSVGKEFFSNFYRPLGLITTKLQYSLFGMQPEGYWITNVLLHSANSLLLGIMLYRLTGRLWECTIAGLIFAVYPIHTEPVLWFCAKFDLMSTFFILLSILLYMEYSKGRRRSWIYALSLASMLFAMLLKEIGLLTPFLLVLCEAFWGTSKEPTMKRFARLLPFFALGAAYFMYTYIVFHGSIGYRSGGRSAHLPNDPKAHWWDYVRLFGHDCYTLLVPCSLEEIWTNNWHLWALGGIYVSLLILLLLKGRSPLKTLLFGLLWVTLTILPIIASPIVENLMRARYYYLPSVGMAIFFAFMFFGPTRLFFLKWVNLAAVLTFLVVFIGILYVDQKPWIRAAFLSKWLPMQIAVQAPVLKAGTEIDVVNSPDNVRGVILYRNGLEEALNFLYHSPKGKKILTVNSVNDDGSFRSDPTKDIATVIREHNDRSLYVFMYQWLDENGDNVRVLKLYPPE